MTEREYERRPFTHNGSLEDVNDALLARMKNGWDVDSHSIRMIPNETYNCYVRFFCILQRVKSQ